MRNVIAGDIPESQATKSTGVGWGGGRSSGAGARARRDELEAELSEAALDALTGDTIAQDRHSRITGELGEVNHQLEQLELTLETALQRDARKAALAAHKNREDGLAAFSQVCAARQKAAEDLDAAAEAITDAWRRLQATERLVTMSLPADTRLPPGYHGIRLRDLAAAAVYRHQDVVGIGDDANAFPGAKPPDTNTRLNPSAIESASGIISDQNSWLLRHVGGQVQRFAEQRMRRPPRDERHFWRSRTRN
jgi:hypothetical protein